MCKLRWDLWGPNMDPPAGRRAEQSTIETTTEAKRMCIIPLFSCVVVVKTPISYYLYTGVMYTYLDIT